MVRIVSIRVGIPDEVQPVSCLVDAIIRVVEKEVGLLLEVDWAVGLFLSRRKAGDGVVETSK